MKHAALGVCCMLAAGAVGAAGSPPDIPEMSTLASYPHWAMPQRHPWRSPLPIADELSHIETGGYTVYSIPVGGISVSGIGRSPALMLPDDLPMMLALAGKRLAPTNLPALQTRTQRRIRMHMRYRSGTRLAPAGLAASYKIRPQAQSLRYRPRGRRGA
jgi:hypothetical protein